MQFFIIMSEFSSSNTEENQTSTTEVVAQINYLPLLIQDLFENNGSVNDKIEFQYSKESGVNVVASEVIEKNEVICSIPYSYTLSVNNILKYEPIKKVIDKFPGLLEFPDEVLAIALLYIYLNIDDLNCPWRLHFLTLPTNFNTLIYWSEEDLEKYFKGHLLYSLTKMLKNQLLTDYQSIYTLIQEEFPQEFSQLSFSLYCWAMSIVYSRALDITRKDKVERVIVPVLDMVNHNPNMGEEEEEEEGEDKDEKEKEKEREEIKSHNTFNYDEETDVISLITPIKLKKNQEVYAVYGDYPNAKLLLHYGFCLPKNRSRQIDLWTSLPPNTSEKEKKEKILKSNPLTAIQTYDFKGTISNNFISRGLMATLRISQATEKELPYFKRAFEGKMISVRNERASLIALREVILKKLNVENAKVSFLFNFIFTSNIFSFLFLFH